MFTELYPIKAPTAGQLGPDVVAAFAELESRYSPLTTPAPRFARGGRLVISAAQIMEDLARSRDAGEQPGD